MHGSTDNVNHSNSSDSTYTLLYFTLLYFTLLYFILRYLISLYFTLLYFTLLHTIFLFFTLFSYPVFYSTIHHNPLLSLHSTILYTPLLSSTAQYLTMGPNRRLSSVSPCCSKTARETGSFWPVWGLFIPVSPWGSTPRSKAPTLATPSSLAARAFQVPASAFELAVSERWNRIIQVSSPEKRYGRNRVRRWKIRMGG